MKVLVKYLLSVFVLSVIVLSNDKTLQAQGDAFFYQNVEERNTEDYGFRYTSATGEGGFLLNLLSENGFTFNGFENGNNNDGFTFDNYDFTPDNAPLGNGLLLLSFGGVFYAYLRRNRKENK